MKIVCISDLHLGDRGPRDVFCKGGREDRFLRFLDWVEQQQAKLFILGDLFDWWKCNLGRSLVAYKDIIQRLIDLDTYWVCGNHDGALVEFCEMNLRVGSVSFLTPHSPITMTLGERTFYFLHGHEADAYCHGDNPGIGEIVAIVSGLVEDRRAYSKRKLGERSFVNALEVASSVWRSVTFRQDRQNEIVNEVENIRTMAKADVVIYGHTHKAGRIGDHHYNCGCWVEDCDTFTMIEDDGQAAVWAWDGKSPLVFGKELG